ncbi:MAG: hypothetical protein JWL85_796, partial [Candidatus Saccharibacteria bacterium]|nr:hypothetical protein [Candidatus Saccharibacteria bacterium]
MAGNKEQINEINIGFDEAVRGAGQWSVEETAQNFFRVDGLLVATHTEAQYQISLLCGEGESEARSQLFVLEHDERGKARHYTHFFVSCDGSTWKQRIGLDKNNELKQIEWERPLTRNDEDDKLVDMIAMNNFGGIIDFSKPTKADMEAYRSMQRDRLAVMTAYRSSKRDSWMVNFRRVTNRILQSDAKKSGHERVARCQPTDLR